MTNTTRSIAAVGTMATVLALGYIAFREDPKPPAPIRADVTSTAPSASPRPLVTASQPPYEPESVQPNVHPISPDEWKAADMDLDRMTVATDTTQPLRKAPVHVVRFDAAALPTPILDERPRECIGYPLTSGFSKVRYNLLLQPNPYQATIRNWSDPTWRETFRVEGGTFPVNLWRKRLGEPDKFIKQVRVQAGPGLPTGNPQEALSTLDFRGGDVVCVEAVRHIGPLFVAYDQQTGAVVQPQLSAIQNASNDSTPVPGAWMTIRVK
jgi:hypothetical protein